MLPLSGTSGPGRPSVSFGHSAGGSGDGSACGVQSAAETWFKGLDDGLAEHNGCMRCVRVVILLRTGNRIWFKRGDVDSREQRASVVLELSAAPAIYNLFHCFFRDIFGFDEQYGTAYG